MTLFSYLPFIAAAFSVLLAFASLLPKKPSLPTWCFFAGMALLGLDSLFAGLLLFATELSDVLRWLTLGLVVKSFVPAAWLGFSLTYSRGDRRAALTHDWIPLAITTLAPIGLALGFQQQLIEVAAPGLSGEAPQLRYGDFAHALNVFLVLAHVWILMNLEQTFRAAVGTMRWRIKFVLLGLAVIFGARLYVCSQVLLFSAYELNWPGIESSGLFVGCVLLAVAYIRTGLSGIDLYPSRAILGTSVTVLMAGAYLFIVGILARLARRFSDGESFQFQSFVVLLGMAGLAVLLLSDRLRQRLRGFLGRHFARAQHDSVRIWAEFSRRLALVKDKASLCSVAVGLVSETFEVLSVTIWLLDRQSEQFIAGASTAPQPDSSSAGNPLTATSAAVSAGMRSRPSPFDLETLDEPWALELRQLNPATFPRGGNRWCVPLRSGEQCLGVLVLADRVNGASYTPEQLQLLECIADQVTSVLLNLQLANELALSSEMEAFRAMSAFFVHDLKNAASSLNLMLKNLPVHFDNPEFRQDALRGIGNTARRIDDLIGRLSALRQRPVFQPAALDLNRLVAETLDRLALSPPIDCVRDFQPLPDIFADREQIQSVVTNLVLNARDAMGSSGCLRVETAHTASRVVLTVADNGCGMSPAFLQDSLFRPFQSNKKNGLGIGMYQSRSIVEAHGGSIRAESETGKGTTFRVIFPVKEVK